MKTTVTNAIYFPDKLDIRLCDTFKKVFPKENIEAILWHFTVLPGSKGYYNMTLEILVNYVGETTHKFVYTKSTSDMQLIDDIKADDKGLVKRRALEGMISNDTFIEELDDFLENIKPIERPEDDEE